ncbi:MAG: membrane-bound lytic murein transglycosylase D [Flavobacteriales bacterium]|jgi:membrane-bound lytic murein transglycosylase D
MFTLALLGFQTVSGQADTLIYQSDTIIVQHDDPQLAAFDSMLVATYANHFCFTSDTLFLNVYDFAQDSIPKIEPSEMARRLSILNAESEFDLLWNDDVEKFIYLYAERRRGLTGRALGMAELYFPIFEAKLDEYDLPQSLKYLPIIESALNPKARSRAGAVGLWQFMYATGKMYGMKSNSFIDERMDPYLSTDAACKYLKKLHGIYDDWSLALAAYNSGPGNVNKAIRRAGGVKDYWAIRPYLPRETRGYVPAFIAVNYVMNHAEDHNIFPIAPDYSFYACDTIHIRSELRFDQVCAFTGIGMEDLEYLNPRYKRNVIPANNRNNVLCIPVEYVGVYLANEDSLFAYSPSQKQEYESPGEEETHIVRRGEVLGKIAQDHHVSVSSLKEWNNLRSNTIHPGQKLVVFTSKKDPKKKVKEPKKPLPIMADGEFQYHVVQSGDTLWDIAKLYDGVSVDQIEQLNSGINVNRLKLGQKIKIQKVG